MIANAYKVGSFYECKIFKVINYLAPDDTYLAPPNQAVVELSCALSHIQYGVFLPLFYFPYFLRAFRLFLVYRSHI
jgi:hypothetical protein